MKKDKKKSFNGSNWRWMNFSYKGWKKTFLSVLIVNESKKRVCLKKERWVKICPSIPYKSMTKNQYNKNQLKSSKRDENQSMN